MKVKEILLFVSFCSISLAIEFDKNVECINQEKADLDFPADIVSLEVNSCTVSMEDLSKFKNLETLGITNSKIEFFEDNLYVLTNLKKLQFLKLSYNNLTTFNFEDVKYNNLLTVIKLSGNKNIVLKGNANLPLYELDVDECGLQNVPMDLLKGFQGLTYLSMSQNSITEIPDDLQNLKSLKKIVLDGNPIKCIPRKFKDISAGGFDCCEPLVEELETKVGEFVEMIKDEEQMMMDTVINNIDLDENVVISLSAYYTLLVYVCFTTLLVFIVLISVIVLLCKKLGSRPSSAPLYSRLTDSMSIITIPK